jgi:glycosyltransferase involved in cell wall biosynthesis
MDGNMKICVDLSAGVHGRAGIGRYAVELLSGLVATDLENQYTLFYNRPEDAQVPAALQHLPARTISSSAKYWRFRTLLAHLFHRPQELLSGSVDVFHATSNLLPNLSQTGTVFTLHDLIFQLHPATHTRLNRWFLSLMMPIFLRKADHIIAVSNTTASDAVHLYNLNQDKMSVIYEGITPHFQPVTDDRQQQQIRIQYALPQRFIFFVGTLEPRKNLPNLIRAFAAAKLDEVKLVIAGKRGWMYQPIFDLVQELGLEQDVQFVGFIPDEDLPALYSLAEAFVFPSLYEGFGLPVLEAMACGTPVITSNISSLPEVTGDAALLIDPSNVQEMSLAIGRLVKDASLRQELGQRGLCQASQFSWRRAAEETLDVYRSVSKKKEHNL